MTDPLILDDEQVATFRASGFVVLRDVLDATELGDEVDAALDVGVRDPAAYNQGPGNRFQYVPMMTARTPRSLALLHDLVGPAGQLLGADPVPLRAKGTRYSGSTDWHRDSDAPVASIGFLAYLEPLLEATGALRVIGGSHRPPHADPHRAQERGEPVAVATMPGDLIAFDEHLLHSSSGGDLRRQWRVDFVAEPTTPDTVAATRTYLAGMFDPGWDGGYDVDRFPSYDVDWQASTDRWTPVLASLGVYELAARQEAAVRRTAR